MVPVGPLDCRAALHQLGSYRQTSGSERRHALEVKGQSDDNTMAVQELLADAQELEKRWLTTSIHEM